MGNIRLTLNSPDPVTPRWNFLKLPRLFSSQIVGGSSVATLSTHASLGLVELDQLKLKKWQNEDHDLSKG